MKMKVIFQSIIFFGGFLFFNLIYDEINPPKQKPEQIISYSQGKEDNPFAASEFRFKMIAGSAEYIDPLSRKRAIEYTNNYLLEKSTENSTLALNWTALGPGNIGGRIRSIVINPTNTNHILIGSVSGGIWKTTDGGGSWSAKIDDSDPLSISCMAIDPSNSNVVYAGTGEAWTNFDAVYGGGVYKSTNFGDTWTLLSSTTGASAWNFKNILQIRVDASGRVYAVTKAINYKHNIGNYYTAGGLYKSTDGGASWSNISPTAFSTNYYNGCDAVVVSSTTILFATGYQSPQIGGIYRTTNGGANWTQITAGLPTSNYLRIALAQDPSNNNKVYAVFESSDLNTSGDGGLKGIYKSIDGGVIWSAVTKPQSLGSTYSRSYLGTQGWYNNVIAVDPHSAGNVYIGGIDMMKSTDGGTSWSQLTYWHSSFGSPYVHCDHHAIAFDPNTANIVYSGNDGGIYKSTNGGNTWSSLNNGLAITQFYGGSVSNSGSVYFAGTQDNGHQKYNGSGTNWTEVYSGDGGYCAVDQSNSNIAFEEYVYLDMRKTTNGGSNWYDWTSCISGLADAANSSACLFIAPFSMNPENSSVLVAGSNRMWITSNSGNSWTQSSNQLVSGHKLSAVSVYNTSANYLGFAGSTDGRVFKCTTLDPNNNIDQWFDITPTGNNGAWVRRIAADLNDKQKIFACYSGYNNTGVTPTKHVWYSSNQGTNWSDISGNLPDVPVHSIVLDPNDSQSIYIGTETGVYQTTNRGTSWSKLGSGMPDDVPVDELVLQKGTNLLFAFTHGRGAFVTTSAVPVELISFNAECVENIITLRWKTASETNSQKFDVERARIAENASDLIWEKIASVSAAGNSTSPIDYVYVDSNPYGARSFKYRLKQIDVDGSFQYSNTVKVDIDLSSFNLYQNYPNPFNPSTTIKYSLDAHAEVEIYLSSISGERIRLLREDHDAGIYNIELKMTGLGKIYSSGVYFITMVLRNISGEINTQSIKIIYLK